MSDMQFSKNEEIGRIQKARNRATEQALASLKGHVIGSDKSGRLTGGQPGDKTYGKVRIWHFTMKKWLLMKPVDAAELLAIQGGSLEGPAESENEQPDADVA
jgi:hypothetical protein